MDVPEAIHGQGPLQLRDRFSATTQGCEGLPQVCVFCQEVEVACQTVFQKRNRLLEPVLTHINVA